MSLAWFNIRSKEVRIAESEPMISAMYNSSSMGPNANQGQDFGWRLHPEVVIKMRGIIQDRVLMERISVIYGIPLNEVDERAVLNYISDEAKPIDLDDIKVSDFEDEYREMINQAADRARIVGSHRDSVTKSR